MIISPRYLAGFILICGSSMAQTISFNSNSTGLDGDFIPNCPIPDTEIIVDMGVTAFKHFSSINIAANCIIKFKDVGNSEFIISKPVIWLSQGNVLIDGVIDLNANGSVGGPGGFNDGSQTFTYDSNPFGPANTVSDLNNGRGFFLSKANQPLIGASGSTSGDYAGGGAILIATSGKLTLNGSIEAFGRNSTSSTYQESRGMVKILATELAGSGSITSTNHCFLEAVTSPVSLYGCTVGELQQLAIQIDTSPDPTLEITSVNGEAITAGEAVMPSPGDYEVLINTGNLTPGSKLVIKVIGGQTPISLVHAFVAPDGTAKGTLSFGAGMSEVSVSVHEQAFE